MMKRSILVSLAILMLCLHGRGISAFAAQEAGPTEAETITVGGQTYTVVPDETMRELGFEFADVSAEENAATYYLRAFETYQSLQDNEELSDLRDKVLRDRWTDESAPLSEYLRSNEDTLRLLEQAAALTVCRFPMLVPEGASVSDTVTATKAAVIHRLLPVLARMRELSRLVATAGRAREFEEDYTGAIETYVLALRIGDHTAQYPFLVTGMTGIACEQTGFRGIDRCLVQHDIDEDALTRLQKRLHVLSDRRPRLAVSLRGERALFSVDEDAGAFMEQVREDAREFWSAVDEALELPLPEFIENEIGDELARMGQEREFPPNLSAPLGPIVFRARILYARDELCWTVLDVEFALARYASEHDGYPESLDEIKDLMLSDGIDPFSGEPLHYRLEPDGAYTIWSVGENLVDDGGEVGSTCPDWRADDYVWNSAVIHGG